MPNIRKVSSLFQSLTSNRNLGLVTLAEVYRLITTDAALKENAGKFRYFRAQGFDGDADRIKRSKWLVFTPAAVFDGKRLGKNRVSYTQYSLVDIDKLEEGQAERLMQRLKDDPYWLLAYITLSGKAAVSLPQVVERAAYARNKEVRPHLASFCGTGNQVNFLTDLTGNRRWLPFFFPYSTS